VDLGLRLTPQAAATPRSISWVKGLNSPCGRLAATVSIFSPGARVGMRTLLSCSLCLSWKAARMS
jgi:hypothetical protein